MAVDWGEFISGTAQSYISNLVAPSPGQTVLPAAALTAGNTPGTVMLKKKCRRRRRRLLTPTDLSDLAALKTITGNNDALKFAVMKAVRR